jgi:N-acetylglucosamine-6-phosphate deacetylase
MDILNYENIHKSDLLVEQHFHGAFGVDFSICEADEILILAKKLLAHGIGGFYPTLVTDSVENIKRQIERIKTASKKQTPGMAQIFGIHLEGIFINPEKKGIHDEKLFLKPTVENYKLIEDDFIKIVTLAPELDENGELRKYLTLKGVKVQAGHCVGPDLEGCSGATHLFNAMSGINHRARSASLSALIDDNIYTEIIADGIHLSDDIIKLVLKAKPEDKIILVSDSLPFAGMSEKLTTSPSPLEGEGWGGGQAATQKNLMEIIFAGEKVFYDGKKATSKDGTIAGSTAILDEIVRRLALKDKKHFEKYVKMASGNVYKYHNINLNGCVYWDERFDIVAVEKDDIVLYRN